MVLKIWIFNPIVLLAVVSLSTPAGRLGCELGVAKLDEDDFVGSNVIGVLVNFVFKVENPLVEFFLNLK